MNQITALALPLQAELEQKEQKYFKKRGFEAFEGMLKWHSPEM